jgi:hypothetical protein
VLKPKVGRTVNYVCDDGHCEAAIIVWVWSDTCVNLFVTHRHSGCETLTSVNFCEPNQDGRPKARTWHNTEREEFLEAMFADWNRFNSRHNEALPAGIAEQAAETSEEAAQPATETETQSEEAPSQTEGTTAAGT